MMRNITEFSHRHGTRTRVPTLATLPTLLLGMLLAIPWAVALQTTQTDKLTPGDALAGDRFGAAVALSDDLLVVGAPGVDGAGEAVGSAYVYQRNVGGAELWATMTELFVDDLKAGDTFGAAVAIHNDLIAIGAPGDDSQGTNSGAVYLFQVVDNDPRRWRLLDKLTPPEAGAGQQFGQVLALDRDTLVVAAPFAAEQRGSVFSFIRADDDLTRWQFHQQLQGDNPGERFGSALALRASLLAVGAPGAGDATRPSGQVHLYRRSRDTDNWQALATLNGEQSGSGFGASLALADNWLAVGAGWQSETRGAVHLFRPGSGSADWRRLGSIQAADAQPDQRFGSSVAISSSSLVVGASLDDSGGANAGAMYIFDRDAASATGWRLETELRAEDTVSGDQFGGILALDGTTIVVGVPNDSDVGVESGAAYTFLRAGNIWQPTAKITAHAAQANDQFGFSVALRGDTLVVGAHFDSDRGTDAGSAYVFQQTGAWTQQARLLAAGTEGFDRFGQAVAVGGDSLAVGALGDDDAGPDTGAVFVFHQDRSQADGWASTIKLTATDADPGDSFGNAVALDDDILLVGAFADDEQGNSAGAAYLFQRHPGEQPGWQQTAKLLAGDGATTHQFGISVALAGNIAVVGAHFDDHAGTFAGSAYVFERQPDRPDLWQQTAKLTARDARANDQFGYAVAVSGDFVAVGAPGSGAVYLFQRGFRPGDWQQTQKFQPTDGPRDDQFGFSVALNPRWLVAGARRHAAMGEDAGAVYVFSRNQGGTERWGQFAKLTAWDAQPGIRFGETVSVDDATLAVGAPFEAHAGPRSGAVYLFRLAQR